MKKNELNKKDLKLLLLILEESLDNRIDMGCNDPYDDEEDLFTEKERIQIQKSLYEDELEEEEMDGFLFNHDYVQYLINKIKS